MSDTHTPGPWGFSYIRTGKSPYEVVMSTARGDLRVTMNPGLGLPEREANARLIAAAPDLLAALENVRGAADRLYLGNVYDVVLAAIAKAKGEA